MSRRSLLAAAAAAPILRAKHSAVPIGLELYSVRDELQRDPIGTVRAVGKMGYQCVEFFSPYYEWTVDYAREMRKVLDESGLRCFSTHNSPKSFTSDGMQHAVELNQALGSKYIVMASAGKIQTLDGWKKVAETLSSASEQLRPKGLAAGYHNHQLEFTPVEGKRPMEVLAANTPKDFMLQLDVGTCLEAGSDPVAWIHANPGRIRSLHCKEWSPTNGYRSLIGEGQVPWKKIAAAAQKTGGAEYFLIEQEGSNLPPMETAQRCLETFRKLI